MVKTIRVSLDDVEYERLTKYKGETTWHDVLVRGIESLVFFDDMDWVDEMRDSPIYLSVTDEDGNLK